MVNEVYKGHGIRIRQIKFTFTREPSYEIERHDSPSMMTRTEFTEMVLTLVEHLMRSGG